MSEESPATLPEGVLVFGPPGAGVPAVTTSLSRAGMAAAGWEGGPQPHLAADPDNLISGRCPVLLALEAADGVCLQRGMPPWAERPLASELALAVHELAETRERLFPARIRADVLLDSTHLSASVLSARVRQLDRVLGPTPVDQPTVVVESFAYPRGVPLDLGWCVDTRALKNPYWEPSLRMLSGLDSRVQEFVLGQLLAARIVEDMARLVSSLVPELQARSRRTLRLAVGCTGGYHRSVVVAEELGGRLRAEGMSVLIWHRDLPERP